MTGLSVKIVLAELFCLLLSWTLSMTSDGCSMNLPLFQRCALFAVVVSVSATCEELNQCFKRFGYQFAHLGEDALKHPEKAVDILCQNPSMLTDCFEKFRGCETFEKISELVTDTKEATKQINMVCQYKGEYVKAMKCIMKVKDSMSQSEMQRSNVCAQEAMQSSAGGVDRCMMLEKMMTCSSLVRKTITCTADFIILLKNKGMNIPCFNVYKEASSGSRLSACSVLLLPALLVVIVSKFFLVM